MAAQGLTRAAAGGPGIWRVRGRPSMAQEWIRYAASASGSRVLSQAGEGRESPAKSDEAVWLGTARPPVRGACEELGLLAGMQLSR